METMEKMATMKHLKIKKPNGHKKRKPFIKEGVLTSLPKPKFPFFVIWTKKSDQRI